MKADISFDEQLGKNIEYWRKDRTLSQLYVASELNISRSAMSLIESGERKVSAEELIELANILSLSV